MASREIFSREVLKPKSMLGGLGTSGRVAMQRTADPWTRVQIPARAPTKFHISNGHLDRPSTQILAYVAWATATFLPSTSNMSASATHSRLPIFTTLALHIASVRQGLSNLMLKSVVATF